MPLLVGGMVKLIMDVLMMIFNVCSEENQLREESQRVEKWEEEEVVKEIVSERGLREEE